MGPYCKFCNNRCFVYLHRYTPKHIVKAYGTNTIIATCPAGQKFEKDKIGYCYDDIMAEITTTCDHCDKEIFIVEAVSEYCGGGCNDYFCNEQCMENFRIYGTKEEMDMCKEDK